MTKLRGKLRLAFYLLVLPLPWPVRRVLLVKILGYKIARSARIGMALVLPDELVMAEGAAIGGLTVCKGMKSIDMAKDSSIGRGNWISAHPAWDNSFFSGQSGRQPMLVMKCGAAITSRHIIDCSDLVEIGEFSTLAGFGSQLLTHSIDLAIARQTTKPVIIGDYCFVGTSCVLLPGAKLPRASVLGGKALLAKQFEESYTLYGGVPAAPIKKLPRSHAYFHRTEAIVR